MNDDMSLIADTLVKAEENVGADEHYDEKHFDDCIKILHSQSRVSFNYVTSEHSSDQSTQTVVEVDHSYLLETEIEVLTNQTIVDY